MSETVSNTLQKSRLASSPKAGHFVIGDHVGQAGPDFPKPMLDGPDPLAVLHMLCDGLVTCSGLGNVLNVL